MSNLTKYEILKHRHLSLLKKLEERGIEAHCSQLEGEWQVTLPQNTIEVKVEGDTAEALDKWLNRDYIIGYWDAEQMRNAFLAEPLPPKTIAQLLDMTAKAVGSPPKTIMGIPVVNIDSFRIRPVDEVHPLDKLRAWLLDMHKSMDNPIVFGIDLGEDADPQQNAMADALNALRENPRPLYSKRCPVDFSKGAENFGGSPFNYPVFYARDWYEMDEQGDVSFHRDAEKNVPDWVRGFDERQGMPKRAVDSDDVLRQSMLAAGIRSIIGVKDDEVLSVGAVGVYRTPLTPSLYHLTEAIHHAILSAASAKA